MMIGGDSSRPATAVVMLTSSIVPMTFRTGTSCFLVISRFFVVARLEFRTKYLTPSICFDAR